MYHFIKFFFLIVLILLLSSSKVVIANDDWSEDIEMQEMNIYDFNIQDKFECINRNFYYYNRGVDEVLILPLTKIYGIVTLNDWTRSRINNVIQNLYEPNRMINSILYGSAESFFKSTFRFIINSTVGILGLFDPAKYIGIAKYDMSFREVLSKKMCTRNGQYIVLPILGPSTSRNTVALIVDNLVLNPFTFLLPIYATATIFGLEILSIRYEKKDVIDQLRQSALDEYSMAQALYYQSDHAKEYYNCRCYQYKKQLLLER